MMLEEEWRSCRSDVVLHLYFAPLCSLVAMPNCPTEMVDGVGS